MNSKITSISLAGLLILAGLAACTGGSATADTATTVLDSTQLVKRGEYLVSIIGCDDCHSPKRMGAHGPELIPELRLSGYPHDLQLPAPDATTVGKGWVMLSSDLTSAVGPWGQSFAANITSDATGIGNWPEENFIRAMRHGKFKGSAEGRDLLPPMPWFVYKNMSDEDLRAIFAYLKTTPPVHNVVPAPKSLSDIK